MVAKPFFLQPDFSSKTPGNMTFSFQTRPNNSSTDKNLLFMGGSLAKFALCVNEEWGPICGVLGLWYRGRGCGLLEKVRIEDGLS